MTIIVETGARVHMGLIDLARATDNAYGGVGFGIDAPATVIEASSSTKMSITNFEGLPASHQQKIMLMLTNIEARYPGISTSFAIKEWSPIHAGFGSCTALLISIAKAHVALHGIDASPEDLQRLTGRGGTSGIGLNVFFTGGFIRDSGRPWSEITTVGPSSASKPTSLPRVLANYAFPSEWRVALVLPEGEQVAGRLERQFFIDNVPSVPETLEVALTIDTEIVPAVAVGDFERFRIAVNRLGGIGFKAREMLAQSGSLKRLLDDLAARPALATGMSSFGPLLYAIWHKDSDGFDILKVAARIHGAQLINAQAAPLGRGHVVHEQ